MIIFVTHAGELEEAVGYELHALEYLRATLFKQSEACSGRIIIDLGNLSQDGRQIVQHQVYVATSISESAVREALHHFRPLAFSATFKLQDMIVEWILRANGKTGWRFKEKLDSYDSLRRNESLEEPPLFSKKPLMARAFWDLYRFFVPFRGAALHSGGVELHEDGTIQLKEHREGRVLRFISSEQGSYMRSMCIVTKLLTGQLVLDPYIEALLDGDFHNLERYHDQNGFAVRSAHLQRAEVIVPREHVLSWQPLCVRIDFDQIRQTIERSCPVGVNEQIYFSLDIVVECGGRKATWELPVENVPSGEVTICGGDARYDRFLRIATTQ